MDQEAREAVPQVIRRRSDRRLLGSLRPLTVAPVVDLKVAAVSVGDDKGATLDASWSVIGQVAAERRGDLNGAPLFRLRPFQLPVRPALVDDQKVVGHV